MNREKVLQKLPIHNEFVSPHLDGEEIEVYCIQG